MSSSRGISAETRQSVSTPDRVESRLGTSEFDDGASSEATSLRLYNPLQSFFDMTWRPSEIQPI
jgi:hypothetical protein